MTMLDPPAAKYRPFTPVHLRDRRWPDAVLTRAPIWLTTDLRDGNQALIEPMDGERKLRLFEMLVKIGFKQIEVGFPAASQTEFDFVRRLIDERRIPADVTIQVMTPARDELIRRSFEALRGAPRAVLHLYNAIAPVMRRVVFGLSQDGVVDLAVRHAGLVKDLAAAQPDTQWTFQYSPETFSDAELPFARRVVDAVTAVWQPTPEQPCIINLPTTIEHSTPNIFADMVEWMHRHIARREAVILSIHPHNDRGTGVAAGEFALMAGADRMEGCLFGNGERTGNVDLVNLALNLYTQGVAPGLDFSDIDAIRRTVEHCNQLPVHPRHPYAGDLVYTSFSGSHQDAIKKAFAARRDGDVWDMPYLPIDPKDLGRSYEAVIRVNSQSGKGGIAYLMEAEYGLALPRRLQIEFASSVQAVMDAQGRELTAADIWQLLAEAYRVHDDALRIDQLRIDDLPDGRSRVSLRVTVPGSAVHVQGEGHGPVDALVQALRDATGVAIEVLDLHEHAITDGPLAAGQGAQARAAAYLELRIADTRTLFGVGLDASIVTASMKAVVSGLLRAGIAPAPRRQATLDVFNA